jgi:ABC-type branched-subunit amino acid transport system substrate-binding protein
MLRRAFVLLIGTLGLAACGSNDTGAPGAINQPPPPGQSTAMTPAPTAPLVSGPVAILLPLTGNLAEIGQPMLRAAQLAMAVPGSPPLDIKDTGGTPEGAAQAAVEAIAAGDRMILGPLTSAETAQVAPIARRAGVPVLAFTNDTAQSQPGVWTLGITPGQQVRRLMGAVRDSGNVPVAALLPDNDFGKAMGDELTRIAAAASQPAPFVRMIAPGPEEIVAAVNELAGMAGPGEPLPFGSILLASTGSDLKVFAKAFADAKIDRAKVQILGPALWADPASGSSAMQGGWFAMPDPAARLDLIRDYTAAYKAPPPPLADLAYDAASIARVLGGQGRMNAAGLTQPVGFTGVDGWFALLPEGQVRRGLAVFRVDRARPVKIGEAPGGPGT